jgi:hypothetical protein
MEPAFGADFSRVRIHRDDIAAQAADGLHAKAFTVGQDIFFGRGSYAPESSEGFRLLAHELTHTLQQPSTVNSAGLKTLSVSSPGDPCEHEADAVADRVVAGVEAVPASTKRANSRTRSWRTGLIQTKLIVGAPGDEYEREAESAADAVVRAPQSGPVQPIGLDILPLAQRAPKKTKKDEDDAQEHLHTQASSVTIESSLETIGVPELIEAQIESMRTGGHPLPRAERAFYEHRFGYDFSGVRMHTEAGASQAAAALSARAFTVGQHIFFGSGEYRPQSAEGRHLVAHELAHTIQQAPAASNAARRLQRGWLDQGKAWALGKVKELAIRVPGYKLLTALLRHDPITDELVEQSPENLIHGVLQFVPDGEAIFQNLQASKTIQQFVDFFNQQVAQLNLSWDTVRGLFQQAWDSLDFSDILSPSDAWEKLKSIFLPPLERLKNFAINVGGYIIDVVKKKLLEWLRDWATKVRGYPLFTFILGKDPFTDEPVVRTPGGFVKAVLSLVHDGDKIFDNLQKSHTIERTVAWLHQEVEKLDLTWDKIKALFRRAWDVISISDILHPIDFVDKIRDIFEAPAIRVVNFAFAVGKKVFEFIFEGVMILAGPIGQHIVAIFRKASAAISTIAADPIAFLGHLLDAVKLGFKQFVGKIGQYLEEGVIAWLVGALERTGVVLPKTWDLKGILSLVLQILGITYLKMRTKLVKALGENGEKIVRTAERAWDFLVALATEGPAAAWHKITDAIGNFWGMVIGGIKNWAITKIIKTAVTELLTMFNPVGAVIEAIIEIYRAVAFFVQRINQILALVDALVDSIANIAAGKISAAANYVEKTLARTIPVIVGFLASLINLGDVGEGIRETIASLQQKVDEAIDTAIQWMVEQVKALFGKEEEEGEEDKDKHDEKWDAAVAGVKAELEKLEDAGELDSTTLKERLPIWQETYGFHELSVETTSEGQKIEGAMSDEKEIAEGHTGEKSDPFPLIYPKPRDAYKPLFFGPPTDKFVVGKKERHGIVSQKVAKKSYDDETERQDYGLQEYVPFPKGDQQLDEGEHIGIEGEFVLEIGDLVGPLEEEGTPGGDLINDLLKKYGYDATDVDGKATQGDHYWEMQYGGKNVVENLWPLDTALNNASGNKLKNHVVTMPSGKERKVSELKHNVRDYWFRIEGFEEPNKDS